MRVLQAWMAVAALLALPTAAAAQLQQGSITGVVLAPDGQPVDAAVVTLMDPMGGSLAAVPARGGSFSFTNVAPGTYSIRADAPSLHARAEGITVTSALPVQVSLRLSAVATDRVDVRGEESPPPSTTTRVTMGGDAVRRAPARIRSRGLQDAIATAPGWATEDNGLLHVRGVDDGFLYVIDGVPVYERLDGLFGMAPDPALVDSLNVVTGYIAPEFGWKSGGVIEVRSAAHTDDRWSGSLDVTAGGDDTTDASIVAGGPLHGTATALTLGAAHHASSRFLDPVHPDNLHNDGRAYSGGGQFGWSVSARDSLTAVAGVNRSTFDVPHGEEQEEAGQNQRQRTGQGWQTLSWQRAWTGTTMSQVAAYHRQASSAVAGSAADTPLFLDAERKMRRTGVLAGITHQRGAHVFKAGAEASTLRLEEGFLFAVVEQDEADETGLREEAAQYTRDDPFRFSGSAAPSLYSVYAQDSLRLADALTVDAGIRADWSRQLLSRSQVSPRVGVAYRFPVRTTTLRASYGRFFQPPQPENLLLASSEQAWALSPFRGETDGGAGLEPERQQAFEAAIEHRLAGRLRLDVAYWRRTATHVSDPNVFFGTTIVFPNSVAEGRASGVDVRLELPRRRGVSGFVSYGNSRVVQYGPITGGLFLEDEVIEIGPGTAFTPDHDQRNVGAFNVSYDAERRGVWLSLSGRYESGTPLEVEEDELDELAERPGAELVDFERGRVKPRAVFDAAASTHLLTRAGVEMSARVTLLNVTGRRWAYNFGNPFSGTHFGPGRTLQVGVRVVLR